MKKQYKIHAIVSLNTPSPAPEHLFLREAKAYIFLYTANSKPWVRNSSTCLRQILRQQNFLDSPFSIFPSSQDQLSLDWVESVESLCKTAKSELSRSFADQFQRAALSIPLNLAEGNGWWHVAEKRQFFGIARGSVFECVPLLKILKRKKFISDSDYKNAGLKKYKEAYEALKK